MELMVSSMPCAAAGNAPKRKAASAAANVVARFMGVSSGHDDGGNGGDLGQAQGTEPKTRAEIEFDPERPTKIIAALFCRAISAISSTTWP